jgi:hypothetical protein
LNADFTCEIAMHLSQRRILVLGNLVLCAMGLAACQTTGAPEKNAALGAAQSSPRAATLGANLHQAQAKSLSGSPKQASRPDQPTIIGIAF